MHFFYNNILHANWNSEIASIEYGIKPTLLFHSFSLFKLKKAFSRTLGANNKKNLLNLGFCLLTQRILSVYLLNEKYQFDGIAEGNGVIQIQ